MVQRVSVNRFTVMASETKVHWKLRTQVVAQGTSLQKKTGK